MSKKKLSIDCVDLKLRIQERIDRRTRRMTLEEIRLQNEEKLDSSKSSFARWWRGLPMGPVEEQIDRERKSKPAKRSSEPAPREKVTPVKVKQKVWRRKKKSFDCVEFKRQMQEAIRRKYRGMTMKQRIATMQRRLETSDDPFVKRWRSLPEGGPSGVRKK